MITSVESENVTYGLYNKSHNNETSFLFIAHIILTAQYSVSLLSLAAIDFVETQ